MADCKRVFRFCLFSATKFANWCTKPAGTYFYYNNDG